jgi:molecular chaperone Hsp33
MSDRDRLRRFLFQGFPVRGEIVRLGASWQAMLERQDYPPAVRELLGEAMVAAVLLASTLKFDGMLTMQIQGEGDLHLLVAQCGSDLSIRGLAKWKGENPQGSLAELTGGGRLAITIERGREQERYQGIVLADTDTLASCLEGYFARSEQLPTRIWLAADASCAGGLLLQRMPETEQVSPNDPDGWNRSQMLADTISSDELLGIEATELLRRLFHAEDMQLEDGRAVTFLCSCNRGRVEAALRLLGREELAELLVTDGHIEVRCEFCNKAYGFDSVDVEQLLAEQVAMPPPPSSTLH